MSTPNPHKDHLDGLAIGILIACCMFWGLQQILVKAVMAEVPPLMQASVRCIGACVLLMLWCRVRGIRLLERDGNSYDRKSPIERAFAFAAQSIAQKTAEQMLADNAEFKAALEGMVAEAASKVIGEGRAQMVDNIARAISKGLEPRA